MNTISRGSWLQAVDTQAGCWGFMSDARAFSARNERDLNTQCTLFDPEHASFHVSNSLQCRRLSLLPQLAAKWVKWNSKRYIVCNTMLTKCNATQRQEVIADAQPLRSPSSTENRELLWHWTFHFKAPMLSAYLVCKSAIHTALRRSHTMCIFDGLIARTASTIILSSQIN